MCTYCSRRSLVIPVCRKAIPSKCGISKLSTYTLSTYYETSPTERDFLKHLKCTVQIFSGATLRELDAGAYEEAPPLSQEEIAEELGRSSEGGARPGSSSRSLGGHRRSLGRHPGSETLLCQTRQQLHGCWGNLRPPGNCVALC